MTPSRREFFRIGCCSLGALGLAARFRRFGLMSAMAQSAPDYRALVCIFLFGGNDGNNLIVPLSTQGYDAYASARKELALPSATLLPVTTHANEAYGLHPKLVELQPLFAGGSLAVVANVGTLVAPITRSQYQSHALPVPSNLFSHSDQQLQWQTSISNGFGSTGWAGRAADAVTRAGFNNGSSFPAFVSVAGNSMLGNGNQTSQAIFAPGAALGLQGFSTSAASQARQLALQELLTLDTGVELVQAAGATLNEGLKNAQILAKAMTGAPALQTAFPKTTLGAQLQQVAKIIQVRSELGLSRQIFFCSLGGFDTHTAQLNDQQALLAQLSQALTSFHDSTREMAVAGAVTAFTESDFGRTFQPNTNHGTDHAWGSHHLVLGGSVKGGDLYGRLPEPALGGPDDVDTRGRWIPTTSLDQYGATLASWFGVAPDDLSTVFPNVKNFPTANLGFLG
jgi:uncharacterized protein (DUF1501 family)